MCRQTIEIIRVLKKLALCPVVSIRIPLLIPCFNWRRKRRCSCRCSGTGGCACRCRRGAGGGTRRRSARRRGARRRGARRRGARRRGAGGCVCRCCSGASCCRTWIWSFKCWRFYLFWNFFELYILPTGI